MYIIVGLGNPGKEYENTRHNLGFITCDQLSERHGIKVTKSKFKSLVGEGIISGEKVLIVKPQTYMNNSGQAVREVMDFYKEEADHLLVIYDDIDIPLGSIRIRKAGSAGTHNGMKSILYHLQTDQFPRIRIGIGAQRDERIDLVDYVIGGFTKKEVKPLEEACLKACDAIECFLKDNIDITMNRFNHIATSEDSESKGNDSD